MAWFFTSNRTVEGIPFVSSEFEHVRNWMVYSPLIGTSWDDSYYQTHFLHNSLYFWVLLPIMSESEAPLVCHWLSFQPSTNKKQHNRPWPLLPSTISRLHTPGFTRPFSKPLVTAWLSKGTVANPQHNSKESKSCISYLHSLPRAH